MGDSHAEEEACVMRNDLEIVAGSKGRCVHFEENCQELLRVTLTKI